MVAGGDQGSPLTVVQDQVIKGSYRKGKTLTSEIS